MECAALRTHRFPRKSATLIEAIVGTSPTADTGESLLDEEIRSDLSAPIAESRDIFRHSKYFGPSETADMQEQPQVRIIIPSLSSFTVIITMIMILNSIPFLRVLKFGIGKLPHLL